MVQWVIEEINLDFLQFVIDNSILFFLNKTSNIFNKNIKNINYYLLLIGLNPFK